MFWCNDCERLFEEVKVIGERHPYGDSYATEEWCVCPFCKDNAIEKAVECCRCEEYMPIDNARFDDDGNCYCDICYEEMFDE